MTVRQEKYLFSVIKKHEEQLNRIIGFFSSFEGASRVNDGASSKPLGCAGTSSPDNNPQGLEEKVRVR